jgi:hypothetical protein
MKHLLWLSVVAALAAGCGGEDDPPAGDGTFGAACTMVSEPSATECDSGVCTDSFDQIGHPVCSVKCTQADPSVCPEGSEGKKCNGKGYCKP